ncbi:uncharacterized protein LOC120693494 isoform X3 [Panicum virgatum]|uniref:uncharacterized protein LOC120693494 isoform X3 n=1 Tax=Panicum virgatum TaxID=38727 RepID=UPI0019D5996B|nr:uncharacterized protein LOC120693494 isoform X3 [Panicum virgatum]
MAARVQAGRTRVTAAISRHSSRIYLHRSSSHLPLAPLVLTAVQQVTLVRNPSCEVQPLTGSKFFACVEICWSFFSFPQIWSSIGLLLLLLCLHQWHGM